MQVFGETLGEGDILDVIRHFDPENTGSIALARIKRTLNKRI